MAKSSLQDKTITGGDPDWEMALGVAGAYPLALSFFVFALVLFSLVVLKGIVGVWYTRNQYVDVVYV